MTTLRSYKKSLLYILNNTHNDGAEDPDPEFDKDEFYYCMQFVAEESGFEEDGSGGWRPKDDPRFISQLGAKATDIFKQFVKAYDKNYRVDLAVKEFYKLTDDEIVEMMDELPYYNRSFKGEEKFKPIAANFLKGKIWQADYPRKINRDRSKKKTLHEMTTWEEYLEALPKQNIDTIKGYIDLGIKFQDFKNVIIKNARKES